MDFINWLESKATKISDADKKKIFLKATSEGIGANRGIKPQRHGLAYASDPGDFGRGIYYSSNWHRARSYANSDSEVEKSIVKFQNPIILSNIEAYSIADKFNTVKLTDEDYDKIREPKARAEKLLSNAQKMTDHMIGLGHDGLIAVDDKGNLEIVDYRPYFSKS